MHPCRLIAMLIASGLLAACAGGPNTVASRPPGCAAAADSVAANPVSGAKIRITKAEDQAATPTVKAHCLVEGAVNERVSAVDGQAYSL